MFEKSTAGQEALMWPFVAGKVAMDIAVSASLACARMAQIALQSADQAVAKYIELTELEMKKGQQRESVKVE
jgi:hypothetical protein